MPHGPRELLRRHGPQQANPALVQRLQSSANVHRRMLRILQPSQSASWYALIGASISVAQPQTNVSIDVAGQQRDETKQNWRTVHPPSRYGVSSASRLSPATAGALPRGAGNIFNRGLRMAG